MGEGFVVTEIRYDDVASREVGHLCAFVEEASELLGVDGLFGGDFEDGVLSTVNSQRSTVGVFVVGSFLGVLKYSIILYMPLVRLSSCLCSLSRLALSQ